MANRKLRQDNMLSRQHPLFDTALSEGHFDVSLGLRQCLSRCITQSGKDRYQVAAEISRLAKTSLSKDVLDKYCSSNLEYGIRAEILTAFCYVTGTFEPFQYLLLPLEADVLNPEDRDLVELARLQEQERDIQHKIAKIRQKRGFR